MVQFSSRWEELFKEECCCTSKGNRLCNLTATCPMWTSTWPHCPHLQPPRLSTCRLCLLSPFFFYLSHPVFTTKPQVKPCFVGRVDSYYSGASAHVHVLWNLNLCSNTVSVKSPWKRSTVLIVSHAFFFFFLRMISHPFMKLKHVTYIAILWTSKSTSWLHKSVSMNPVACVGVWCSRLYVVAPLVPSGHLSCLNLHYSLALQWKIIFSHP